MPGQGAPQIKLDARALVALLECRHWYQLGEPPRADVLPCRAYGCRRDNNLGRPRRIVAVIEQPKT